MNHRFIRFPLLMIGTLLLLVGMPLTVAARPNVIYIMADDLGYGDVGCFGGERCKIPTPGIDRLAREGMRFTDAHTIASVCVPSRLAIMTGRYPWRIQGSRVNGPWGFLNPRFPTEHFTIGRMLRNSGYRTGYVGKWHLGLLMQTTDGKNQGLENVDYTRALKVSPQQYGFDYSFILPGSLDMYPYVFVRDGEFVGKVTKQRGWSAFNRVGPTEENFEDYNVLDTFSAEVEKFIAESAPGSHAGQPFFLYFALTAPHTPTSPHPKFEGSTELGLYGDFVHETDNCVVRTLAALQEHDLADNTLVIFTSDHGPAPYAGNVRKATYNNVKQLEAMGHFPSGIYRGYKFSVYEGGMRIPFVVRWPRQVAAGSTCDQLIGLNDLMATLADVCQIELAEDQAVDSVSYYRLLKSPRSRPTRENLLMAGTHGYAVRWQDWKLCLCPGSGSLGRYGNLPKPEQAWASAVAAFGRKPKREELLAAPFVQLFNLADDPTESHNLAADHPQLVRKLYDLLEHQFDVGRSTVGPPQENDRPRPNYWGRLPAGTLQP